jgi:acyl carrier protein
LRAQARFLAAGADIDPDLSLASLGVDSLDIIELVVQIEGTFDVEIPPDRVTPETFSTPASIWRLLCEHAAVRDPAPSGGGREAQRHLAAELL